MDEIQIARLALMMVGGLGVILVLLGVTFNIIRFLYKGIIINHNKNRASLH